MPLSHRAPWESPGCPRCFSGNDAGTLLLLPPVSHSHTDRRPVSLRPASVVAVDVRRRVCLQTRAPGPMPRRFPAKRTGHPYRPDDSRELAEPAVGFLHGSFMLGWKERAIVLGTRARILQSRQLEGSAMFKDFKTFVMRGNVLDLGVAVIIGGAFGKVVSSFVNDLIMPPVGLLLGRVGFGSLYLNLSGTPYPSLADAEAAGAAVVKYGAFVNTLVDFLIVSAVIFLLIRAAKRLERPKAEQAPAPATKECPHCLSTIPLKATKCAHCTSPL